MGHEVKMRPHRDQAAGVTIIPDPTQTALSAAVIVAWRMFVKILSVEHDVYLQVNLPLSLRSLSHSINEVVCQKKITYSA